jgi:hydrogenase 3 maturation protease
VVAPQKEHISLEALTSVLEEELAGWEQIAILGIGNEFGGDDSLGFQAARKLKRALSNISKVEVLTVGVAPENFTGLLRRLCPSHVVLIDAAEMGEMAGTIKLIEPHRIEKQMPSTHTMPLNMLTEYLEQELGAKVLIIGIQPKGLSVGMAVSDEVGTSIDKLTRMFVEIIGRK